MASFSETQDDEFVKLLAIGDAKAGKTGSLISLVQAGYKLRILDFDNLLEILGYLIREKCPDKIENVEFRTVRDKRKMSDAGPIIDGQPVAFTRAMKLLDRWKYQDGDKPIDLGVPGTWGKDTVVVVDSLSRLCDAAYDWQEAITRNPDGRAIYGEAQDAVEDVLATLTAKSFRCNVIVIAHVLYQAQPDGSLKGFPQGVGQKLSPKIPQYFPSVVLYENKGGKRIITTNSTPLIDLSNPKPFAMGKSYPIETGLADFFKVLQEPPGAKPSPKPTLVRRA